MKKILVVDDDEDLADIVKYILKLKGFNVITHSTGVNVPEVVRRSNPNLVLIDIRLYGESGTDICRKLKRRYDIPIVLFSGDTRQGKTFADCHADGFIEKPFNVDQLVNTINLHLKYYKAEA